MPERCEKCGARNVVHRKDHLCRMHWRRVDDMKTMTSYVECEVCGKVKE
jgi:ribosomal protein S14